jgi:hypothetical protein
MKQFAARGIAVLERGILQKTVAGERVSGKFVVEMATCPCAMKHNAQEPPSKWLD